MPAAWSQKTNNKTTLHVSHVKLATVLSFAQMVTFSPKEMLVGWFRAALWATVSRQY